MPFELFDPRAEISVRHGKLPHWYQPGVTYFVTFRTADSVPRELVAAWHARREAWLGQRGIDPASPAWRAKLREVPGLDHEYDAEFTRAFMEYLDRGYGACPLRNPRCAELLAKSLRHFDGDRYHLGDYVVMPNHVHLLVCLSGSAEIESQCRSWKKFSAGEINQALSRRGRFWQEESFDHLVRNEAQFGHLQEYIAANPVRAGLNQGEFLLHRHPT